MDYILGFIVLLLGARAIYSTSATMSTNYRLKYFRLPPDSIHNPAQPVVVFKPTSREVLNRFIWLGLFAILVSLSGYSYGLNGVMLFGIIFLFPFSARLISRLIHMNDKIIVHHDRVEFIKLFGTVTIKFTEVESVRLRYSEYKSALAKSLFIALQFKLTTGEKTINLPADFFQDKAESILVALQKACPEKTFTIKWGDSAIENIDVLTLQPNQPLPIRV
jgi:hypothetical protein